MPKVWKYLDRDNGCLCAERLRSGRVNLRVNCSGDYTVGRHELTPSCLVLATEVALGQKYYL